MILFASAGCVSQYKYFPAEPTWEANAMVVPDSYTNGTYIVTEPFVNNYVHQMIYLDNINSWRKNNGVP
jgi:hypothetical protein